MPYKDRLQQNAYVLAWMKKRRRKWLVKNGPCRKCGSKRALQVDHIDPTKKVSHKVWSWSAIRRELELKKCRVLCKKCHDRKSVGERAKGTQKSHLTEGDVRRLRYELQQGLSLEEAARRYALSKGGVRHIERRRTWKHV